MKNQEAINAIEAASTPLADLLEKPVQHNAFNVLLDTDKHNQMYKSAEVFSNATSLPGHWRMKPADVFTALCRAYSLNVDPLMFLENSFAISGKIGMSSQLQVALANQSGKLADPIDWTITGEGETLSVTAYTTTTTGKRLEATVSYATAKADGWTKNPKYKSMPGEMLRWRAASWLIRRYMPEVVLGMYSADELIDGNHSEQQQAAPPPPAPAKVVKLLNEKQIKRFNTMCAELSVDRDAVKKKAKVDSMKEIPAAWADKMETYILQQATPALITAIDGATDLDALSAGVDRALTWYDKEKFADLHAKVDEKVGELSK